MDFAWSSEQLSLRQAVADFAAKELRDGLGERDRDGVLAPELWQKCADFGILGLPIPEQYGGTDTAITSIMLMMEGLGYGCPDNGLIFSLNAQLWSIELPILTFGSDAQKDKYLPGLVSGTMIGAHGMSEPDSGSDAFSLRARARRVDGGYLINGTKTFVTNAPIADMAIVFASTDPDKGRWGISAFIMDRSTPGLETSRPFDKMGLRTSPMGELILQDCFVPEASLLGAEGMGVKVFSSSMEWERACILASHVGTMQRQLEACVAYARQRRQFGQPIAKFQSVSNRVADMKVRLETARLLLYKVAWLMQQGKPATVEAAMAKLYLSECFVRSCEDAIRIHGGYGYMTELGIERDFRDSIGGLFYSGTSDIQRNIIARLTGL
jgi:alkylation response protein AidB-like acyl-CoA dehydrogenase